MSTAFFRRFRPLTALAMLASLLMACLPQAAAAVAATEEQRITDSTTDFGRQAVRLHGDTLAVSAEYANSNKGAVKVYTRNGAGVWSLQATLIARTAGGVDESASFTYFGYGVALDQDTIAITCSDAPQAWIYTRSGSAWSIQQRLTVPANYTRFAVAALQNDTLVLTAAPTGDTSRNALIYTRSGSTWTHVSTIAGNAGFESQTRLDGRTLLTSNENQDKVYVYEQRADGTWALVTTLTPPETLPTNNTFFFPAVGGLSIDGDTIVIGAAFNTTVELGLVTTYGKAFVYRRNASGWYHEATLTPSVTSQKQCFGAATAIRGDLIAVGAPYFDIGGSPSEGNRDGAVYLFRRAAGSWSQVSRVERTNIGDIRNGMNVTLDGSHLAYGSRDGKHAVVARIAEDGTAGASAIAVSASGAAISDGAATASTANGTDFGSAIINREARARSFTIAARGASDSLLSGSPLVRIAGAHASDFRVLAQPSRNDIASGEWTTVTILFEPSAAGTRTARVEIESDAAGSPYTFAIGGTGDAAAFSSITITGGDTGDELVSPNNSETSNLPSTGGLQFGRVLANVVVDRTFFLRNTGTADLTLGSSPITINRPSDPNWSPANLFSILSQPAAGTVIAPGESVPFVVRFAPTETTTAGTTFYGRVSIPHADGDAATPTPYPFIVSGIRETGTAPSIQLQGNSVTISAGDTTPATADHTDFGNILVAGGSVTRTFTIRNVGTATLTLTGTPRVAISGNSDFSLTQPSAGSIAAGGSLTFTVTCDPSSVGLKEATLSITSNNSFNSPYTFAISAVGTASGTPAPQLAVSGNGNAISDGDSTPATADHTDFGSVASGGSINRDFILSNPGDATLTISSVTLGGADAASFSIIVDPAASIDPGTGTTTLRIQYHPSAVGTHTATVTIASNDATSPFTWTIRGTATVGDPATGPEMDVSRGAAIADAGSDTVTGTSIGTATSLTYVVANSGSAVLTISGAATIGGESGCTATVTSALPGSIAAAGSANLVVSVTPSAASWSFTITIPNNDADEAPYNWTVSGTATAPSALSALSLVLQGPVPAGATSVTVDSGSGPAAATLSGADPDRRWSISVPDTATSVTVTFTASDGSSKSRTFSIAR